MRVKILKSFHMGGVPSVQILPGSVIELPAEKAQEWIKAGYAGIAPMEEQMEKAILPPGEQRELGQVERVAVAAKSTGSKRKSGK